MKYIFIVACIMVNALSAQLKPYQPSPFDEHALPHNAPSYAQLQKNGLSVNAASQYLIQLAQAGPATSK